MEYFLRWIKTQPDSRVIKATHLVGVSHLVISMYEYREVNILTRSDSGMLLISAIIMRCTPGGFPC